MNTANRYILQQVSRPLLIAIAIGLLLLLSERLVRLLEITLGQTEAFSLVFEMLSYLVPHYMGLALPGAFFVGLMFGINRLSKDSEIDAFLASGIGLHQLAQPLIALSLVFTIISFFVFSYLQPYTRYAYRMLVQSVQNTSIYYLAEEGVFMHIGHRTFALDEVSREKHNFGRIFIFTDRGDKGHSTTTARSGRLIERGTYELPVLRLSNGMVMRVRPPSQDGGKNQPLKNAEVTFYDRVDTLLGKERGPVRRARGKDQRELTIFELWQRMDDPPKRTTRNELVAEFNDRLLRVLTIPILPILAIPFALSRRRGYRSYRFATAIVLLVVFNEFLQNGKRAVALGNMTPLMGQWLPIILFAAFAFWSFYRTAFTIPRPRLDPLWERLHETLKSYLLIAARYAGFGR